MQEGRVDEFRPAFYMGWTMHETTVELLTIGYEVLAGNVLDTNSHWLCQQIAARGARVLRITVLPDEIETIAEALRDALARQPALIVTCGGLGPTVDDLTTAAVAAALGRPLGEDPTAYGMVRDRYAELHQRGLVASAEMTSARAKMACLPAGAEPLTNTVGGAPGVLIADLPTVIASLPGVPAEMKDIFEHALWPRLETRFGGASYAERTVQTDCLDETIMAPAVDAVAARHQHVYVKSRAQVYGNGAANFVTLAARAASVADAGALLTAAEADLREALAEVGVQTV